MQSGLDGHINPRIICALFPYLEIERQVDYSGWVFGHIIYYEYFEDYLPHTRFLVECVGPSIVFVLKGG